MEETVMPKFCRNYSIFSNSWQLKEGLEDHRLRLQPLSNLSAPELCRLRGSLGDWGNTSIDVQDGGFVEAKESIWVSLLRCHGEW